MRGSIDFAPFGIGIQAPTGVFNLFKPTNDPDLTLMVYELAFQHQGQDYYLAGRKEVKDDPGFDLWSDTTTLYTTLHEGQDKHARIVGAGVLTLCIRQLGTLLSTVAVPNASMAGKLAAIASSAAFSRAACGPATLCRNSENRAFRYAWRTGVRQEVN